MINRTMAAGVAAYVVAAVMMSHQAQGYIALAVGVTDDPNHGIAIGTAYNYKTLEEARDRSLHECRIFKTAPKAGLLCRLIGVREKGCLSAAFDPKSDSTGMGWAMAEDRSSAERQAMDACRAAAPSGRAQFCAIDITRCEGDEPATR